MDRTQKLKFLLTAVKTGLMAIILFSVILKVEPTKSAANVGVANWLSQGNANSCSTPVRIMPLGDSITQGSFSGVNDSTKQIAYRYDLWRLLTDRGYPVDFVGSMQNGEYYQSIDGFDTDHEGHAGWRDDRVAGHIFNWLTQNPADVVLLHIGTNSLNSDPGDVENILDQIDLYNESITVVLARIINRENYSALTTTFNNNVAAMAQERIALGDKIILVDMEDGAGIVYDLQPAGDMWDNLHPYETGYTKMAAVWFDALETFLPLCETSPVIISLPVIFAAVNEPYIYDVNATGQPSPTYSLTTHPNGMTIDPNTGVIAWTPLAVGNYNVTVQASNTLGIDTQSFTLTVGAATPTNTPAPPTATNTPTQPAVSPTSTPPRKATNTPTQTAVSPTNTPVPPTATSTPTQMAVSPTNTPMATNSPTQTAVSPTNTPTATPINNTPIALWHFDDASSAISITDAIGGHNGQCVSTTCPASTTGWLNGAFLFDGSHKVDIPQSADFDWAGGSSFSIELWLNVTQACSGIDVLIGRYKGGSHANWWLGCDNNLPAFFLGDSDRRTATVKGTTSLNDGQWHHIVAVRDSSSNQNRLYVDGNLEGSIAISYTGSFFSSKNINIGYFDTSPYYYFNGRLDEVAIYNTALTPTEVQNHASAQ